MTFKPNEFPKKKKINRKRLDAVIDKYIEDNIFEIEIPDGDKVSAIQFKRFMTPIERSMFLENAATTIVRDNISGAMMIHEVLLELRVHDYIITFMSSMQPVTHIDDETGKPEVDTGLLSTYGTYFRKASKEYEELFASLYELAWAYCSRRVQYFDTMFDKAVGQFDMNKFMTSDSVLDMIKQEILPSAIEKEPVEEVAVEAETVVPFPTDKTDAE